MARLEGKQIRATKGGSGAPEVKFEVAFQTAGIPMSIATVRDGRLLEVNDAFCEASGYARYELIGRSAAELGIVSPRDREAIVGAMPNHGIARDLEITFRRRDGSVRRGFISASAIEVEGEPCFLNATIDLTDRWAAEQALRESEERFRTIFDSAGDGIVIFDKAGRCIDANPAACELFGYNRDEFMELSSDALATTEETALTRDRLALVLERGFLRFESTFVARDGSAIPTQITATPMELNGSRVALVIGRDLTESKLAESQREAAQHEHARIARLAAAASALDATISASSDEESLFGGIARLLVSIGGLATATVALKEPAGRLRIHAVEADETRLQGDIETPEGSLRFATEAETQALQTGHAVAAGTGAVLPIGARGFAVDRKSVV
jgi:PAS domain S-box-containing protein